MKKTAHQEWHSACPQCGGTKRFWVNKTGHFQCRECDFEGWLDDDQPAERDPLKILEWQQKQKQLEIIRQSQITERFKQLRTLAEQDAYLLGRDDEANMQAEAYFTQQGFSRDIISEYHLGYTPHHVVKTDVGDYVLAAYTIPIYDPVTFELVNIQYRLVDPPAGIQKYRQSYGIPAAAHFADFMPEGIQGPAIWVEGAKKDIYTHLMLDRKIQVVGFPGNMPSRELLDKIKDMNPVWICLDLGAEKQSERIRRIVIEQRIASGMTQEQSSRGLNIVSVPGKIDDLFREKQMTVPEFREICRLSA